MTALYKAQHQGGAARADPSKIRVHSVDLAKRGVYAAHSEFWI